MRDRGGQCKPLAEPKLHTIPHHLWTTIGAAAEAKYGAPYLLMHRGDLHEALASCVPSERIALDKKLVELDWRGDGVALRFADSTSARADAVVAADGIHSRVRELWLGAET